MPPRKYRSGIDLCSAEGCSATASTRGMCAIHYSKWRKQQARAGLLLPERREPTEDKRRLVLYVLQSVLDYLDAIDQLDAGRRRVSDQRRREVTAWIEQRAKIHLQAQEARAKEQASRQVTKQENGAE